jgi:hypothetical protein
MVSMAIMWRGGSTGSFLRILFADVEFLAFRCLLTTRITPHAVRKSSHIPFDGRAACYGTAVAVILQCILLEGGKGRVKVRRNVSVLDALVRTC